MRIYLIRHADPDYPNNTITGQGHQEAEALAERMAKEGLTRIYSSPLPRAIHTAEYTARRCGLEPLIEPWTCEHRDCDIEPAPWSRMMMINLPGEIIRGQPALPDSDTWQAIPFLDDPRLQNAVEQVAYGSDQFLRRHGYERVAGRYRCVSPNHERIAVFCHGGFGLTWLAHLLALPVALVWCGFWLPPSSVTTILMEQRSPAWAVPRCLGLGDVSHLYHAGLPVQPRGIVADNW